nr:hypothetical protein [Tanacetum cinerariifolium]GEZ58345.1 hypothetical protein [Tanacetum cinerariifolium]
MVTPEARMIERYIGGLSQNIKGNVTSSKPTDIQKTITMAQSLMDQVTQDLGDKAVDNKRKWEGNHNNNNNYYQNKHHEMAKVYTAGSTDKGKYARNLPHCSKCNRHHNGPCPPTCNNYGRMRGNQKSRNQNENENQNKNQNKGNQNGGNSSQGNQNGNGAYGRVYELGRESAVPDNNVVMGTFLINNHYASVLFYSGADRSFAWTTFSEYLNIVPTTIDNVYHVELADEKSVATDTILRGCTLNLQKHPFNIDLIPIELRSFDVIMKRSTVVQGVRNGVRSKSTLSIISHIKTHKYIEKGCPVFLIQVTEKGIEEKQLKDLPMVRNFPEVSPEDFPGLPPARQVEFQNRFGPWSCTSCTCAL